MSAKKGEYGVSPMPSEPPAGWKAPSQEEFSKPTVEGSEELDAEAQAALDRLEARAAAKKAEAAAKDGDKK